MAQQTEKPVIKSDLRQQKLQQLLSENLGKTGKDIKSMGELMLLAGYSESYAENPQQLTQTAAWQRIMDKQLPDDFLAKRHKQLLNKRQVLVVREKGKDPRFVRTKEIDPDAVAKGLTLAYKLKGRFVDKFELDSSEKLDQALDRLEKLLP